MAGTRVRILLARHGETLYNVEGRWQGQSDSPLTERGRGQARELARALADEQIAAVYSSDLGRAANTAQEVALLHAQDVITDIEAEFPGGLNAWRSTPTSYRMPNGESLQEAQSRALNFFSDRMPNHAGETVVVVSHGAVGQAILVNAMGRPVEDLWLKERVDNCQLSRLEWTLVGGLELIELADVRHLEDVGSLQGWRTTDSV